MASSSNRRAAARRPGPALGTRFLVDWGGPPGSQGFARVEIGAIAPSGGGTLALTRAVDGRRDLFLWLRPEPAALAVPGGTPAGVGAVAAAGARPSRRVLKPPPRTVSVTALDGAGRPVARYRFEGAVPLSLALSPLDAREDGLLMETLTLSYRTVTMAG